MANPSWYTGQASAPGAGMPSWTDIPLEITGDTLQRYQQLRAQRDAIWAEIAPYAYKRETTSLSARALIDQLDSVEAEIANLERLVPWASDRDLQSMDPKRWEKAIESYISGQEASGAMSQQEAVRNLTAAKSAIRGSVGDSGKIVFGQTQTPEYVTQAEGGTTGVEQPTATTLQEKYDIAVMTSGDPIYAAESIYGVDKTSWPASVANQVMRYEQSLWGSAEDQRYRGAQAQQLELENQYRQRQYDIDAGVLGGMNASGRFPANDVMSYINEGGPLAEIAGAQWAEMTGQPTSWEREQWQAQQDRYARELAAEQSYRQQALAQQAAYQQAQLEQARREMAARIGQAVADMANQSYVSTLGQRLPAGTEYAPGFGPGGVLNQMANMSGLSYTPSKIGVANPPTADELMSMVQSAINKF